MTVQGYASKSKNWFLLRLTLYCKLRKSKGETERDPTHNDHLVQSGPRIYLSGRNKVVRTAMFILTEIVDTIRIQPHMLFSMPTLAALHCEIDMKYPNRVLYDVGLVIGRHGQVTKLTNGSCVPGDGGCHHDCLFQIIVFRPFVDEVCVGKIVKSTPEGVHVSLGFFQDIFIPAYWMLRPSHYDESSGLWVWSPNYDDEEDEEGEEEGSMETSKEAKSINANGEKRKDSATNGSKTEHKNNSKVTVKQEGSMPSKSRTGGQNENPEGTENDGDETGNQQEQDEEGGEDETGPLEMEIGAEIRFKVKSIHFTQVTNTAKGVQATTITTAYSHVFPPTSTASTPSGAAGTSSSASAGSGSAVHDGTTTSAAPDNIDSTSDLQRPLNIRKRSTSVDLSEGQQLPPSMHIIASICEDGLGLTDWWKPEEEEDAEEEQEGDEDEKGEGDGRGEIENVTEMNHNVDEEDYGFI